jgi:ribonuclease VapC
LIVDTSALAAIALGETQWEELLAALSVSQCIVPAPVLTELQLAQAARGGQVVAATSRLIEQMLIKGTEIAAFEHHHAGITAEARERYGKGNGRGGRLNFGDLMVYAIAKDRNLPLLCTGGDFATTDIAIHPASRIEP